LKVENMSRTKIIEEQVSQRRTKAPKKQEVLTSLKEDHFQSRRQEAYET
jgi:hypothetical protein